MKTGVWFIVFVVLVAGIAGTGWGFTGGTKMVATMTYHPEYRTIAAGATPVLSYEPWKGSKPVLQFLRRLPEPTLSAEKIREEMPGPSSGTKLVVLFQMR